MAIEELTSDRRVLAKVRYSHKGSFCTISKEGEYVKAVFEEPVRASTPGQALVFYENDYVLGGGTIVKVWTSHIHFL